MKAIKTLFLSLTFCVSTLADQPDGRVKVLFLGDKGHHVPGERLNQTYTAFARRGIDLYYTEDMSDLNPQNLARYHVVMVYANIARIDPEPEKALIQYIRNGGGFAPIHCASYCFQNSEELIRITGAQFKSHKTGEFTVNNTQPDHPITKGLAGFTSWDETYIHTKHNSDRAVLEVRQEGDWKEPWTWVRSEGKGRVFYTAWGHDQRTWGNPGFQELLDRGIRWAAGDWALSRRPDPAPFTYQDAKLPWYVPGAGRKGDGVWGKMQEPLSVEQSMKRMILPPGFKVSYFAGEPEIRNPLTMAWDERGRLWISESADYPNELQEPGKGRDRLVICQDADGDGKADRFTVFADKLSIPTSIAFWNGGVIVHQAPHTLYLKDTDGDGKADLRQTILTGWGTRDTHAGPNNLQFGFDNWIWGMQGYSGFDGRIAGKTLQFGMGFHRFKPDGSILEYVRQTNNNTWGIGFGEDGVVFGSTANNNPGVHMPIANRYYESVTDFKPAVLPPMAESSRFLTATGKVRQVDVHGGYTAAAGHALYTARQFPREYWNRAAFVAEPTGHLIGTFFLRREGADFKSANTQNLMVSDDEWTAPIMAEVGPDGAVWFIDWYAYIVQHNPTPAGFETGKGGAYEIPLRAKRLSRIYRITYGEPPEKPSSTFSLAGASPRQLVAALKNDNLRWRLTAQRLLVERGNKEVVPALIQLAGDSAVDEIGLNVGAIHALHTLQGLGALDGSGAAANAAAYAALKHGSAAVRRNALTVLPPIADSVAALLNAGSLKDADDQVRLAALLALADLPDSDEAGRVLFEMVSKQQFGADRWLIDAATAAAAKHHKSFLAAHTAASSSHLQHQRHFQPVNLIVNPSFEEVKNNQPVGWAAHNYSGKAAAARSGNKMRHDGGWSAMIDTADQGADAAFKQVVKVKPDTQYRLSGWIKTQKLETIGGARGALLNVHELQGPDRVVTTALKGNADWTRVQVIFDTRKRDSITINCLVGGWGKAKGLAWFDDIELVEMAPGALGGPADELLQRVAHHAAVMSGQAVAGAAAAAKKVDLELKLGTVQNLMRYDQAVLHAKRSQTIRIVFSNNDHMPHNLLILQPGSTEIVGAEADKMALDPKAMIGGFIPNLPQVLGHTKLVNPGETDVLEMKLPDAPGRYPYVCTFPGHWRIMSGTLVVE